VIDTPRGRWAALASALLCVIVLVVLSVLVSQHWSVLEHADARLGRRPQQLTFDHAWLRSTWLWVGRIFETWPMAAYTLVAAGALALKGHRRAAIWTVLVMASVLVVNPLLKALVARDRPVWDHPVETLSSYSFPSGHSSGIAAAAGVAVVLALMLVRRRGLRHGVVTAAVVLALAVGGDRVFLGVHNVSDVLGGYLLGAALVLGWLLVFDPEPRSIAQANDPLPQTVPSGGRRVAAILNPVKVDDPAAFRAMVDKMAADSGWEQVTWWEKLVEDSG
jgi:membrane-associated phospholipid phosphatase